MYIIDTSKFENNYYFNHYKVIEGDNEKEWMNSKSAEISSLLGFPVSIVLVKEKKFHGLQFTYSLFYKNILLCDKCCGVLDLSQIFKTKEKAEKLGIILLQEKSGKLHFEFEDGSICNVTYPLIALQSINRMYLLEINPIKQTELAYCC